MTAEKGPHRAIAAARAAGVPLVLAGVIQPGQQAFFDREVAPHIDGDARPLRRRGRRRGQALAVRGRPRAADADPLGGAVRDGDGRGAGLRDAGDRVPRGRGARARVDGQTGFLVEDERAMAAAVGRLPRIAARDCRAWVAEHCDVDVVAAAYERPTARSARRRAAGASRLSERTLSVLDGSTFVVGDRLGDLRADEGREHGFFCDDTRFLSRWVLRVGEEPLELLGLDQSAHFAARFFLTPRVGPDEQAPCSIMRRRLDRPRVDGGDHGHQPPPRAQRAAGGAGARHRLRRPVRGQGRRGRRARGDLPPRRCDSLTLAYERDGFQRSVTIAASRRRRSPARDSPISLDARARRAVVDHLHGHAPRRAAGGRVRAARAAGQPRRS